MVAIVRFVADYPVNSGEWVDPRSVTAVAQRLEQLGIHGLGFTDHPAPSGKWLDGGGHETFDPFAAMAFCAGVTATITLFSHLVVVPYRNPLLQASAMASVDVLAGGRTVFVVGAGYLRSEFAALGVDFDERNELFDEGVEVIRAFSSGEDLSFQGRHFTALGQRMRPLSVQRPHPPLWVGGNSGKALERVASWGAGWSAMVATAEMARTSRTRVISTVAELRAAIEEIGGRAESHGRSLADIEICASHPLLGPATGASPQQQVDAIAELAEAGMSWTRIDLGHAGVDATMDLLAEFQEKVLAKSS